MANYFIQVTIDDGYSEVGRTSNPHEVEVLARAIVARANAERRFDKVVNYTLNPEVYDYVNPLS